jgi:hypothetical protein
MTTVTPWAVTASETPVPSVRRDGAPRPLIGTRHTSWRGGSDDASTSASPPSIPTSARKPNSGAVSTRTSEPSGARSSSVHPPRDSVTHKKPDPSSSQHGAPSSGPPCRSGIPTRDPSLTLTQASSCSVSSVRVAPVVGSTSRTARSVWSRFRTTSVSAPRAGHDTRARYGSAALSHLTQVGVPPATATIPRSTDAFAVPARGYLNHRFLSQRNAFISQNHCFLS